ncbi:aldehyde ferredoxin oxidoreductase N-terminal domain-containing protein [Clostridium thailandense]|nr:aldehyde ferredoxin oxidoreductase N-terminal domain-containing protein [Clostridium thailandense]
MNLTEETVKYEEFNIKETMEYGRGLAAFLIIKNVSSGTDRYDGSNAIVLAPGLCSGTLVPSTGRITIASKKSKSDGIQFADIAGPFSQKLASLDIAAVVMIGKSNSQNPITVVFSEVGTHIEKNMNLKEAVVSDTINEIRKEFGLEAAIIGIGPTGEHLLPLSSLFSTYPEGKVPEYHCTRGGMGDIFGSKGIKALVVKSKGHFNAEVLDKEGISKNAKKLGKIIVSHPICGGALPGYGSITLMKMLKQGRKIDLSKQSNISKNIKKYSKLCNINKTCSPICVIGCLNRHLKEGDNMYSSPAESEVYAALKEAFNIDDKAFASTINKEAFELGLDSVELVFSIALYYKAIDKNAKKEEIIGALDEIKKLSVIGRLIGSKTQGIYSFYSDKTNLKPFVTKPSVNEEGKFSVLIKSKPEYLKHISDLDYLYAMMTILGNFGICLFSAFALIENEDILYILSEVFFCKTGIKTEPSKIIKYSLNCMEREITFETNSKLDSVQKTIPEFVKVLYRYFDRSIK